MSNKDNNPYKGRHRLRQHRKVSQTTSRHGRRTTKRLTSDQRVDDIRRRFPELAADPKVDTFTNQHGCFNKKVLIQKHGYCFIYTTLNSMGVPQTYGRSLTKPHLPAIYEKDTAMPLEFPTLYTDSAGAEGGATDVTDATLSTGPVGVAAAVAGAVAAAGAGAVAAPTDGPATGAGHDAVVADGTATGAAAGYSASNFKYVTVSIDGISASATCEKRLLKRQTTDELASEFVPQICPDCRISTPTGRCWRCHT